MMEKSLQLNKFNDNRLVVQFFSFVHYSNLVIPEILECFYAFFKNNLKYFN